MMLFRQFRLTQNTHALEQLDGIEPDSKRMSGAWVFGGTRVTVAALFDNLRAGATVDEFLDWFPGVSKTHAHNVLRHVRLSLSESATHS